MKIKTMISMLFLITITVLYVFGFCEWDIWIYMLSVVATIVYMLIFIKQEKKYDRLNDEKKNLNR